VRPDARCRFLRIVRSLGHVRERHKSLALAQTAKGAFFGLVLFCNNFTWGNPRPASESRNCLSHLQNSIADHPPDGNARKHLDAGVDHARRGIAFCRLHPGPNATTWPSSHSGSRANIFTRDRVSFSTDGRRSCAHGNSLALTLTPARRSSHIWSPKRRPLPARNSSALFLHWRGRKSCCNFGSLMESFYFATSKVSRCSRLCGWNCASCSRTCLPPNFPAKNPKPSSWMNRNNSARTKILGVSALASAAEIKTAYRTRVKECHPDRFPNVDAQSRELAEEWTKAVNAAYAELLGGARS